MSMRRPGHDLGRVQWIGDEAVGLPGQRTFHLLVRNRETSAELWLEKEQLQALATAESARRLGLDPWLGPMFPFSAGFLAYVVVRSMVVTLRTGGIRWRGTFYPLADLKRNKV